MLSAQLIADNIKAVRMHRNYSQDYLAFKLNMSQNCYSKVECGYTPLTVERLNKIAEILEIDPVRLITLAGINAIMAQQAEYQYYYAVIRA